MWGEYDTTSNEGRVLFDIKAITCQRTRFSMILLGYIYPGDWSTHHITLAENEDIALLKKALEEGSRVWLQNRDAGDANIPRVFIDATEVTVKGTEIDAKTTETLLYDYFSGAMRTAKIEFLHWKFSTTGLAIRYLNAVNGSASDSALSFTNAFEVTW